MPGHNMDSWWVSSQEGIEAGAHYDLQLKERGGEFTAKGDFLFRDYGSFGTLQGLWGILRVDDTSPPMAAADDFVATSSVTLSVAREAGLLANDVDIDENVFLPVFPRSFEVAKIDSAAVRRNVCQYNGSSMKVRYCLKLGS